MKRLVWVALATLLLQATVAAAPPQGKGRNRAHDRHVGNDESHDVDVHVVFGAADVNIIRNHYASRHHRLPPGLQKKLARGGQLPPGWQRTFEPFPLGVERRLPPLAPQYRRGVIDGHAVIYNRRSNVIVDLAVLF